MPSHLSVPSRNQVVSVVVEVGTVPRSEWSLARIDIECDPGDVTILEGMSTRLIQRHAPDSRTLMIVGENRIILRLAHAYIGALAVDQLVCRLARSKCTKALRANLRRVGSDIVYSFRMRNR